MHQQHRKAGLGPTFFVGNLQYAGACAFEHCSPGLLRKRCRRRRGGRHEPNEQTTIDHSGVPRMVASKQNITQRAGRGGRAKIAWWFAGTELTHPRMQLLTPKVERPWLVAWRMTGRALQ